MRTLLLTLCAATLLAGCSNDRTDDLVVSVVGKAQFAAAVDELPAESRAVIADGMTTWQAGDQISITAMIDGTPYIKNVAYKFASASSFGELFPVEDPILWNESLRGERSFFACWPYKAADDGFAEMNCAQFGFSVPAKQTLTDGVNDAKPTLIGSASTSEQGQRPIALRFYNLFAVLNLHFNPFAGTVIKQIVIEPAQEGGLTGYLSASGIITNTGQMTVDESSDKITIECAGGGLDLKDGASVQLPIGRFTVTGGLKFSVSTTDGRTFSEVVFADEPWRSYLADASGNFSKAKYINHTVALEVVSDDVADDTVYFRDDLNWISTSTRWATVTGGGWPTVAAGATSATGKSNTFTVDLIPDFAEKGYIQSQNRTATQARYEGYVCLGTTSAQGALITPALEQIGSMPTDILVSFYGACYATASMLSDGEPLTIKVLGAGTVGSDDADEIRVELTNCFSWRKYWVIVRGATAQTQIQFGQDVNKSVGRVLIDNILIGKAVKGAVDGAREISVPIEPYLRMLDDEAGVSYEIPNIEKESGICIVQSNLPWRASTESDWILLSPDVEYNGAGIAYKISVTAQSVNTTGRVRTADVTFTAGELSQTVRFSQSADIPENVVFEDDFSWCDGDGSTGGILSGPLTSTTTIGSGGKTYANWPAAYKATGWTASVATNSPTARNGTLLCGGTTTTPADVITPALDKIGSGVMSVYVEFDVLEYKNNLETGKVLFTVQGSGTVESIEGHYTQVSGDSWTQLSTDKKTQQFYCGQYGDWSSGEARWHHVKVLVANADKNTKIQLASPAGYSRFWIDNFTVIQKK